MFRRGRGVSLRPRRIEDTEFYQAYGNLQQRPSLTQRWSETDEEYFARVHYDLPRPAQSRQGGVDQETNWIPSYDTNGYGEPHYPPPPYNERDEDFGGGEALPNHLFNIYPGGERRPDYETDSTGRRECYITDEHGDRVAWPFHDHVDTSDDDEESDMVHLESGRLIPRSEWERDHPWEASSDDPSDGTEEESLQRRRAPMPQTRNRPNSASERQRRDRKAARIRTRNSARASRGRRETQRGYGERAYNAGREMPRRQNCRQGRHQRHH